MRRKIWEQGSPHWNYIRTSFPQYWSLVQQMIFDHCSVEIVIGSTNDCPQCLTYILPVIVLHLLTRVQVSFHNGCPAFCWLGFKVFLNHLIPTEEFCRRQVSLHHSESSCVNGDKQDDKSVKRYRSYRVNGLAICLTPSTNWVQEGNVERVQLLEQFHNTNEIAQVPPIMCTQPFHFSLSTILLLVCSFSIQVLSLHKFPLHQDEHKFPLHWDEHKFPLRRDEHKFPLCPCSSSRSVCNRVQCYV